MFVQRVKAFRLRVRMEKESLGLTESAAISPQSTLITVHRSRVVEVSLNHLINLSYPGTLPLFNQIMEGKNFWKIVSAYSLYCSYMYMYMFL